jgi:hypothetical protein
MTGPVSSLMTDRVTGLNKQFKQQFPAADLLAQEWFNEYTIRFARYINATTEETIRQLIEQGVNEGWSVPTMTKHLDEIFEQWTTGKLDPGGFVWFNGLKPDYRLLALIRTETMRALNSVSFKLYGAWGVQQHEWIAVHDDKTRFDHREADGQIVWVGQHFNIGGWPMLYPGDPTGPPEQTVNCRCSTAPIL